MSHPIRESQGQQVYGDSVDRQLANMMELVNLQSMKIPVPEEIGKENSFGKIFEFAHQKGIPHPVKVEYNSQEGRYYVSKSQ